VLYAPVNGRLVLQPVLFHVFDFAFGETVCPEKVARESGAEATAVQTLPRPPNVANPPRSVWTAAGSPPLSILGCKTAR